MGREFDEEEAIGKYWMDHIYPAHFASGAGKYFNIVTEEEGTTSVEYIPPFPSRNRIKLSVRFLNGNGQINSVTIRKFKEHTSRGVSRWEEQYFGPGEPMTFTHFSFEKLVGFLQLLTELDLVNLNDRRIALRETDGRIDAETADKIKSLLKRDGGQQLVEELIANNEVTTHDIVNVAYRKRQLNLFERLLQEEGALDEYGASEGVSTSQPEKVWQYFFSKNDWIFGFGLDYRFLGILQDEARVGPSDLSGRNGAISDFLLGAKDFTVLVELKTPTTTLFQKSKNRANSWQLSTEIIGAVSQILEQKASWQVKSDGESHFDRQGGRISQRTVDPKCILVVGSDEAFSGSEQERQIKLRTFELFRRDSRNVDILTYDELYERAKFIVGHGEKLLSVK